MKYVQKKQNILTVLCLICAFTIGGIGLFECNEIVKAADVTAGGNCKVTGYTCKGHSHSWTSTNCTYSISGYDKITNSSNKGVYMFVKEVSENGVYAGKNYSIKLTRKGCPHCGGSGTQYAYLDSNRNQVASSGSYTVGSGTVYKCTISGCQYGSYGVKGSGSCKDHGTSTTIPCSNYTTNYSRHTSNGKYNSNSTSHWTNCSGCNGTMGTVSHTYGSQYIENGSYKKKCSICSYVMIIGAASLTVTFHPNGGSVSPTTKTVTIGSTYGTLPIPTRAGFSFTGWYSAASGGTQYTSSSTVSATVNHTLFAHWSANTYKVTYDANGGTGAPSPQAFVFGSGDKISSTIPTRTGYSFVNWLVVENNYTMTPGQAISTGWGSITLKAQWTPNKYKVSYHANGGVMEQAEIIYHYNDQVDLSLTAERKGEIFVGWSLEPDGRMPLGSLKMPDLATSEDSEHADWELTLYAVYSIPVSDVANHRYPEYKKKTPWEVFVRVYDFNNKDNYRDYELAYTLDTTTMVYRYVLDADISDFVGSMKAYYYRVYAYDNVENWKVIYENKVGSTEATIPDKVDPPIPKRYRQTVKHYKYNPVSKKYEKLTDDTVSDEEEGSTFTPSFVDKQEGYEADYIRYPQGYEEAGKIVHGSYVVSESATSEACYNPCKYLLTFDANGGKIDVNGTLVSKKTGQIAYSDHYENVGYDTDKDGIFTDAFGIPTPRREGYTFVGWYTQAVGGVKVKGSDLYQTVGDSTLYACWKINEYTVTYDDWTNGGTGAVAMQKKYEYGAKIDLSVTALKSGNGWSFVGWNTNPDATVGLSTMSMPNHNVTVYAIYKKDITVTILEKDKQQTVRTHQKKTIYNNEMSADFFITSNVKQENVWVDWTLLGWTTETGAGEVPIVGEGGIYTSSDDVILYGVYNSEVTLSYDTNGSSMMIEPQTKECFYNASGAMIYPSFIVANEPILPQHSFVNWRVTDGFLWDSKNNSITSCMPKDEIVIKEHTVLSAFWDKHPIIEAYDRYFTLEQAQQGEITQTKLLKKVTAIDKEDILINGKDVIVKGYNASDFMELTTDKELEVTYQATDSYGNTVTKTVRVIITETSMSESPKENYVRFISRSFFREDNGNLVASDKGGLEETSIWRKDEVYRNLLQEIFYDEDKNEEEWIFTMVDIKEMKEYTNTYGYIINGAEEFFERFYGCLQTVR